MHDTIKAQEQKNLQITVFDIPLADIILPKRETLTKLTQNTDTVKAFDDVLAFIGQEIQPEAGSTHTLNENTLSPDKKDKFEELVRSFRTKAADDGIDIRNGGGNGLNKMAHILPILKEEGYQVSTSMLGAINGSGEGKFVGELLKANNIDLIDNGRESDSTKTSIIINGKGDRVALKEPYSMPKGVYDDANIVTSSINGADVVILESKLERHGTDETYQAFLDKLNDDTILMFNPPTEGKLTDLQRQAAKRADLQALNIEEWLQSYIGNPELTKSIKSFDSPKFQETLVQAKDLLTKDTDVIVITNASEGAIAITQKGVTRFQPEEKSIIPSSEIENTIGAGDSFAGVIAAKYIAQRKAGKEINSEFLEAALGSASHVASAVIKQAGAQLDPEATLAAVNGQVPTNGELDSLEQPNFIQVQQGARK